MLSFLYDHALNAVWCNPSVDNQFILNLTKVDGLKGSLARCKIMKEEIELPTKTDIYHVYVVGQEEPHLLGLFKSKSNIGQYWANMNTLSPELGVLVHLYTNIGKRIPSGDVQYMFTRTKALVIVIKQNKKVNTNHADPVYLRVYRSKFLSSGGNYPQAIDIFSSFILGTASRNNALNFYSYYSNYEGTIFTFINGLLVKDLHSSLFTVGSFVEMVYDPSVTKIIDYPFNGLSIFNSVLDNKNKYLLHYFSDELSSQIDFLDDIDFYLVYKGTQLYTGVYIGKNEIDNFRMVTHKDYALSVEKYLFAESCLKTVLNRSSLDYGNVSILAFVRQSGFNRGLDFEFNKLNELYKLPTGMISEILNGSIDGPSFWKAPYLENSNYCRLMSLAPESMTHNTIWNTYGYNAIMKILADTPSSSYIENGIKKSNIPYGLRDNSTVYEYDTNGKMLGYYHHTDGNPIYNYVNNATGKFVECLYGVGSRNPGTLVGTNFLTLPSDEYRIYLCTTTNDIPNDDWSDVTDQEGTLFTINNNHQISLIYPTNKYILIRSNATFLAYDLNIKPYFGNIKFNLSELITIDGTPVKKDLWIPYGDVDLFLNGRSLIEDIDYYINFPTVVIVNKKYLTTDPNNTTQWVHVRASGFCKSDLTRPSYVDKGFIKHGDLSYNFNYDIRDDKVTRIVVDGKLKMKSEVTTQEDNKPLVPASSLNGLPYMIKDIIVPIKPFTGSDTYIAKQSSVTRDNEVSTFMYTNFPYQQDYGNAVIPVKYRVFSPFISNLIFRLQSNSITDIHLSRLTDDSSILNFCQPYEFYLNFDPIMKNIDTTFVTINPYNTSDHIYLTQTKYDFIVDVVRLYCNGQVSLSSVSVA